MIALSPGSRIDRSGPSPLPVKNVVCLCRTKIKVIVVSSVGSANKSWNIVDSDLLLLARGSNYQSDDSGS